MISCDEYLEGGEHTSVNLSNKQVLVDNIQLDRKRGVQFLCPYVPDSLRVRGHFGSSNFDYVKLKIEGCDLGEECFSDEEISGIAINFASSRAHPSLLGENLDQVVSYNVDYSYFKFIDP